MLRRELIVFFVVWLACSCKRTPIQITPTIDEIVVKMPRVVPAELPVPTEAQLLGLVRHAAELPSGIALGSVPTPSGLRLLVEIELGWSMSPDPAVRGTMRSVIHCRIEPRSASTSGAMRIDREALIEKESVEKTPDATVIRDHLDHVFALAVGGVIRAEQLWLGAPVLARNALASTDADLRDEAIRIASERRDKAALPLLLPLLKNEDTEVRDRVIGALAEIGDPRAAKPLAELAKFGDLSEMPKILDAISRVGGPEAVAYLEFVAGGHPSEEIRDLAKRALEHLHEREK